MGKIASLLGIGISVLTFGFLAASCGGDDWRNVGSSGLITIGLWRTCPLGGCYEIAKACKSLKNFCNHIYFYLLILFLRPSSRWERDTSQRNVRSF